MATTLRARYVFPATGDPIPDGTISIEGERIIACGADVSPASQEVHDLGNVAILPGLVNAHVHLDFSDLTTPLGQRGIRFVDWVRQVMAFRQRAATDRHPVAQGLEESLRSGVTSLGDIVQPHQPLANSPADVTAFLELIAPTKDRVAAAVELAKSYLAAVATARVQPGLSPHAPYSVHPGLLTAVVTLSQQHKIPVAMHLAESPEELELLRNGTGPLREFLEELGAWDAATALQKTVSQETRPLDYLRILTDAHRALVVHGNYLGDEEIAFVGDHADRMSAVYCPRTHDWFAHRDYPLKQLLAAGANVALGTDGRGSSPDLSLLGEMRFAAQKHPGVALADILRMGTIHGARALGREAEVGSLTPGKQANLAIVALPERSAADPHELLFDSAASVIACYCHGVAT